MSNAILGIDKLFRRIGQLRANAKQTAKPLRAASVYMLGSIERNFKAQGRPAKWQAISSATVARRRRGRGKGSAQILIDTGRLKNSMTHKISGNGAEIGTNVVYAARQHFGYGGGAGRGRSKTPARPFLMFQDEDVAAIERIFARHISGI